MQEKVETVQEDVEAGIKPTSARDDKRASDDKHARDNKCGRDNERARDNVCVTVKTGEDPGADRLAGRQSRLTFKQHYAKT